MRTEIRFSGFGGQGIILAAVILGRAAVMYDKKFAVQTQVYGPEARGGASMSAVIIDDEPVLYPKVTNPDIFVIMSQEGFEKYGVQATDRAVMLVDSSLVHSLLTEHPGLSKNTGRYSRSQGGERDANEGKARR